MRNPIAFLGADRLSDFDGCTAASRVEFYALLMQLRSPYSLSCASSSCWPHDVYVGKCEKCECQLMAAEPGYRIFVNIWKIGR